MGQDQRQPFFYVCGHCRAATKGTLISEGGASTRVDLEAGRVLDSYEGCTQIIHINPELPSVPDAEDLTKVGGSAFLFHVQVLGGDKTMFFQRGVLKFETFVSGGWPPLKRLTAYYLNRDWQHFDEGARQLVEHPPVLADERQRDDIIHRIYDEAFIPLLALGPPHYPEMKKEWNDLWDGNGPHFKSLIAYAAREAKTDAFNQLQRDLFHLLEQFTDLRRTVQAGLLLDMYPAGKEASRANLRLFRDDFPALRDFYIQTFEQCHRGLRYVIGALNASLRGSEDSFPAWPSKPSGKVKDPLTSLDQISDLVSANKRIWVQLLPGWNGRWDEFFDRGIRNDIGHASVRHRLADGVLERNEKPSLPYLDFVRIAARAGSPILAMLNVLKILRIYAHGSP